MSGVRRAALYLHSLHADDRRWLLENLSPDQREQLYAMLNELEQMQVPKDQAWLPDLAKPSALAGTQLPDAEGTENHVARIEAAHPERIAEILDREPSSVVVQILNYHMWSWRQFYISKQYVQKKRRLIQALERSDNRIKPKAQAALLAAFAARLSSKTQACQEQDFETLLHQAEYQTTSKRQSSRWARLWRR